MRLLAEISFSVRVTRFTGIFRISAESGYFKWPDGSEGIVRSVIRVLFYRCIINNRRESHLRILKTGKMDATNPIWLKTL